MTWDWMVVIQSAVGSFAGVGSVALFYEDWARRRRESLDGTQGLRFYVIGGWVQEYESGSTNAWSSIRVRITPAGPGIRHDPAVLLWVGGHEPRSDDLGIGRFSNEIEPFDFSVKVPHRPDEARPSAKFGLSWVAVHGKGLRNEYVRIDLNEGGIEWWRWKRFYRIRAWWNAERRLGIPWSGQRHALGQWRAVKSSSDVGWHGPIKEIGRSKPDRPSEDVPAIERGHDEAPDPTVFSPSFLATMKGPQS